MARLRRSILPREGFSIDVLIEMANMTVLNPVLLLLQVYARCSARGREDALAYPRTLMAFDFALFFVLARAASAWIEEKSVNWVSDRYVWSREIVLVAGGAGGIGGAIVRLLDQRGITVVVLDVQPLGYSTSGNIHFYHCDLTLWEEVKAAAERVRNDVGHPTVLVNSAGVLKVGPVLAHDHHEFRRTFEVNALSAIWTVKAFLPSMISRDHGILVPILSASSWLPTKGVSAYCASKSAAMAFHDVVALETAHHYNAPRVRHCLVLLALVRTPMTKALQLQQAFSFLLPPLEPETPAEAVVEQILSGRSGTIMLPRLVSSWALLSILFQLAVYAVLKELATSLR